MPSMNPDTKDVANLSVESDESVQRIALTGRLDTAGVGQVELRFNAASVASGKSVVVDLSGLTFMSSLGIRMLVTAAKRVTSAGRKLVLLNPTEWVDESLRSIDLYRLIPVAFSEQEALELLGR